MRDWILLTGTVIAALATAACGSSGNGTGGAGGTDTTTSKSTTTTSGAGGAPSPCGALVWSSTNAPCSACMETSCCDALKACDNGTGCGDLVSCLGKCTPGNDNCATACQTAHEGGKSDLDALIACFDLNCKDSSACGTKVCDSGVTVAGQACGDCLTTSCCDSWKLCSQEPACLDCLVTADASCASNPSYQAAVTCQEGSCGSKCATRICDTTLGYPDLPECNYCLGKLDAEGGCCEETQACAANSKCLDCITKPNVTGCDANAAFNAFTSCRAKCATECGG